MNNLNIPTWKKRVPICLEQKSWKRDEDGYPVFYDDGVCISCKGEAKDFSHAWYSFRYQLLGYCEACVNAKMGKPGAFEIHVEKPTRYVAKLIPDYEAIMELEMITNNTVLAVDHDVIVELERLA